MSQPAVTQPVETKKGSPVRLIVLLCILGVVLAAFLVDMFVMRDSVKAAEKRLVAAANERSEQPFQKNGENPFLTREGVAQAIGFAPTNSEVEGGMLIEYFRWWGSLPLQRRYLKVIYEDEQGQKYHDYEIANAGFFGDEDELLKEAERQQQLAPPVAPESAGSTDMLNPGGPIAQPATEPDSATPSPDPGAEKPASDPASTSTEPATTAPDPATSTADPEK